MLINSVYFHLTVVFTMNIIFLIHKKLNDFLKVIGRTLIIVPIKLENRFHFEFAESGVLLPIPVFSEHPV